MKEIVENIFIENGFKKVESLYIEEQDYLFMENLSEESIGFYLVLFKNKLEIDFLERNIFNYYHSIKSLEHEYDSRMDKNLSLIIFIKSNNEQVDSISKNIIYQIEEDPYYFKKYVCTYTLEQLEQLKVELRGKDFYISQFLNETVNSEENFRVFKNESLEKTLYELCVSFFIKIPFLILKEKEQNIEDLQLKIEKSLEEQNLLLFTNKILKLEQDLNEKVINTFFEDICTERKIEGDKNEL